MLGRATLAIFSLFLLSGCNRPDSGESRAADRSVVSEPSDGQNPEAVIPNEGGLPDLGEAPEFLLRDSDSQEFSFRKYDGRVRLVSFFFTRCPSICPRINGQIAELFEKVSDNPKVLFLSITVDPENDTPQVLSDYARKYRKDASNWKFLTGEPQVIQGLLTGGFKLGSGMLPDAHNTRIVLVDQAGTIRGFYQGMDSSHIAQLGKDLLKLLP
ncbi:MAG: SCO family protein [Bdellovibrionales bacterium]|nr:SCO family protein [Bdellovibrionales bacterium]